MEVDLWSAAAFGEYETINDYLMTVGNLVWRMTMQVENPLDYINKKDEFGLTLLMEGWSAHLFAKS